MAPGAALWACLLFGFFQALELRPDVVEAWCTSRCRSRS
jgi:hypothetical protein